MLSPVRRRDSANKGKRVSRTKILQTERVLWMGSARRVSNCSRIGHYGESAGQREGWLRGGSVLVAVVVDDRGHK